jgi:hypothetical protein
MYLRTCKKVSPPIANPQIAKKNGSENSQIAMFSEGPLILGIFYVRKFAICGNHLWTTHLCQPMVVDLLLA